MCFTLLLLFIQSLKRCALLFVPVFKPIVESDLFREFKMVLKVLLTHYFVADGLLEIKKMLRLWQGLLSKTAHQKPLRESLPPSFRNLARTGVTITLHDVLALIIHSRALPLPRQDLWDALGHPSV